MRVCGVTKSTQGDREPARYTETMATTEQPVQLVSLTEAAAAKIKILLAEESDEELGVLRVAVQGGGCSGFQYALGFDREA